MKKAGVSNGQHYHVFQASAGVSGSSSAEEVDLHLCIPLQISLLLRREALPMDFFAVSFVSMT